MNDSDIVNGLRSTGVPVISSDDEESYEELRFNFNKRIAGNPVAIVLPGDTSGAAAVLKWCVSHGIPFRVRSGGHCYEDWSLPSGRVVLIDVRTINKVEVQKLRDGSYTVVAGAGARVAEVVHLLSRYGLALPVGSCPDIGIAGITLGGGIGLLMRKYGLTTDRVNAIEAVLASGEVVQLGRKGEECVAGKADFEADRSDLFWALRGAGNGNFAVVTRITFKPVVLSDVLLYETYWRFRDLQVVIDAWQRWAPHATEELASSFAKIFGSSKDFLIGGLVIPSSAFDQRTDTDSVRGVLRPFLQAAAPVSTFIARMSCADAAQHFWSSVPETLSFKCKAGWASEPFPKPALDIIAGALSTISRDAHSDVHIELICMGGMVRQIPPDETSFPYRDVLLGVECRSWWSPDKSKQQQQRIEWTQKLHQALTPYLLTGAAYLNSADADLREPARAYYGSNLLRLSQIKAKYDPNGFFCHAGSLPIRMP